ncbi:unnamed protein product [Pleuronectes platessa]|uniref:Uncharacterized protein n=1 Tax=Pleuronectes platessa TaxID=8262 RepID=A0A9N7VJM9_PLEPL|nr:unnamed protein product [Pleuronectes platessa]
MAPDNSTEPADDTPSPDLTPGLLTVRHCCTAPALPPLTVTPRQCPIATAPPPASEQTSPGVKDRGPSSMAVLISRFVNAAIASACPARHPQPGRPSKARPTLCPSTVSSPMYSHSTSIAPLFIAFPRSVPLSPPL